MLTLDIPTAPQWIALPRGVRVRIKPVRPEEMAAAQNRARRQLREIREAQGGEIDPDIAAGLAFGLTVRALAAFVIEAWEGVGDDEGKPAPCLTQWIDRLMDLEEIASAFWRAATEPAARVSAEGNG